MTNLQLTPHFNVSEFERSAYASAHGIDNTVPSQYIPRLEQLCKTILEPLRSYINQSSPIKGGERGVYISSGFRSPILNLKVGGVPASQHTLGEAADIRLPKTAYTDWDDNKAHTDMDIARSWFAFIESHCDFDQLILEYSCEPSGKSSSLEHSRGDAEYRRSQTENGRDYWIHVSCKKNRSKNRHQVFRDMRKRSTGHAEVKKEA